MNGKKFGQYTCPYCKQTMCLTVDNLQKHRCYQKERADLKEIIKDFSKKNKKYCDKNKCKYYKNIKEILKILEGIVFVKEDTKLNFTEFYYHQTLKEISNILKKINAEKEAI